LTVRIREVDPSTAPDGELLALHALEEACAPTGERFRPPELSLSFYRHSSARIRRQFFADENGVLVGAGTLSVYGPTFVYANLGVFPGQRRRGIGTALLGRLRAAAHEAGASSFFAHHWSEAGAAFAARVGARDDQRDVRAALDLRRALLLDPVVPAGWRLLSWLGAAPDDLVESYARARDAMNDSPMPGGMTLPPLTVEDVRDIEQTARKRGREMRVTVAIDERNEVAAFTDVRTTPGDATAATDDTAVALWARGRGIGRAVKLESLRRLRADRPDVELVTTMNAEHNAAMRHINTSVGFVPTATLTTTVLTL
jgi:GNAT superfamily N-acetyltransferase/predicted GNAT family acetyltransferase